MVDVEVCSAVSSDVFDVEARTAINSDVFTSRSISILRPIRPQFYVQFDLNLTSNSTSILRPIRPQFYVQFDLNFTSNSTSILRPIRSQFYVQFDFNFTSPPPYRATPFFCRKLLGAFSNIFNKKLNSRRYGELGARHGGKARPLRRQGTGN